MSTKNSPLPPRLKTPSILAFAIYLFIATVIVLSFQGAGFDASFDLKRTLNSMWIFLSEMFPPNLGRSKQLAEALWVTLQMAIACLLYTSPSPRDKRQNRMPSSA